MSALTEAWERVEAAGLARRVACECLADLVSVKVDAGTLVTGSTSDVTEYVAKWRLAVEGEREAWRQYEEAGKGAELLAIPENVRPGL